MRFLKRLSSRFHLALGMSALVVSLLLCAMFAGLLPDRAAALRAGRTVLAETVGVSAAAMAHEDEAGRLQQVLDFVVSRNPELLSIGLRQSDGQLAVQAGRVEHQFADAPPGRSTETHVRVPLLRAGELWGHAELRFTPIEGTAVTDLHRGSPALLVLAMGLTCFGVFYLYLRRMLRHLDPSRVIPGRVRTAFDTLAEGVLVLDAEFRVVLANQAFVQVAGRTPEAWVGMAVADLGWILPEGVTPDQLPWQAVPTPDQAHHKLRLYLTDQAGVRRSFMVNGSAVPGADGKPAGMLVSLDDVTALEQKELQLRQARDEAEAANRAKSDFLANMSHEIRTPMNAILGFAELLRRGWQHNGARHPAPSRHHPGQRRHLLSLINDILDLSKVEAGRLDVETVDCAVHTVVHEVLDIMRVRAEQTGVKLQLEFPQAMPATLLTDPARLRQIVTNLVGNALKFTSQGSVTVRVYRGPDGDPAPLRIDVVDTGIGIPSHKLESIFEPFVQAESSTTRQFGGTGLGLTISRRFARALGGDIVATSQPGQGSTFHVSLAAFPANASVPLLSPQALAERHQAAATGSTEQRWQFSPATVLVVDDGQENRELVRLVLESVGLRVVEACDGAVALEQAAAGRPALVLMDVQMPVMDGYTATRRLRDSGFAAPVLALTANAMKGFESQIEAAGFTGYLTKPVDIDGLLQTLADHLPASRVALDTAAPTEAAPDTQPAAAPDAAAPPIHSRLAKHARLARVARNFVVGMPAKLASLQSAFNQGRDQELAALAHWLKGAGGTVGFDQFFEPARRLEQAAHRQDRDAQSDALSEITALAVRIVAPPDPAGAAAAPALDSSLV
jgi:PAS domain S-box-containing protein